MCIHGFNESRSFIYTQLYKMTSKSYCKTNFIKLIVQKSWSYI